MTDTVWTRLLIKLTALVYLIAAASSFSFIPRREREPGANGGAARRFSHSIPSPSRVYFFSEGFAAVAFMGDALLFKSWLMVGVYLLIQLKYPPQRAGRHHRAAGVFDDVAPLSPSAAASAKFRRA